uniref:BZIP domain-containing protein n=1 Tax=Meloidogyne hapla TaxID=6305 RepID=A0A1I8BRY0_MELHA
MLGPSSANTNANLQMVGANGVPQFENIRGSVDATGDNTNVSSLSQLSNTNGLQSLFNNQKSDVQSKGAGQASSSNSAMLKRKKRNEEEILKINLERKARSAEENNSLRQLLEKNGNEQIVAYI